MFTFTFTFTLRIFTDRKFILLLLWGILEGSSLGLNSPDHYNILKPKLLC